MTKIFRLTLSLTLVALCSNLYAQESEANSTLAAAEHAKIVKLSYDAPHLAHALQYHQARTMLALAGDYTGYGYSERITENNWFNSQIEELALQLPRMKRSAERMQASEEDKLQLTTLFEELETLLTASRHVHSAIKNGDLDAANRLYYEMVDEPYNASVAAAHTLVSENDRKIRLIGLRTK